MRPDTHKRGRFRVKRESPGYNPINIIYINSAIIYISLSVRPADVNLELIRRTFSKETKITGYYKFI